jgi:secreted PhoX family phosphatase
MQGRRRFLRSGTCAFAAFVAGGLGGCAGRGGIGAEGLFDALTTGVDLLPPDENDVRLPPGFRSRIVARSGQTVVPSSDYIWHRSPDGGACYETDDGGWIYVSNSEVFNGQGGVGAIRFDADGEIVDAYSILEGTSINCAGGKTPWNTWLSCEETPTGLVYECDPWGEREAIVRPALGRFVHEAVAVDPERGYLYLTEDVPDGGFYRFRPDNALSDLASGRLEVAEVVSRDGVSSVVWHPVADPTAETTPTRRQVAECTGFVGGEGISYSDGRVYFTTKGDNRVWQYDCDSSAIDVLYDAETAATPHLRGVDNVTITAAGDVLVAEDGGDMQIVMLTLDGDVIPILQVVGHDRSEICGPAFTPGFDRLYFSSQRGLTGRGDGGITYEISYA